MSHNGIAILIIEDHPFTASAYKSVLSTSTTHVFNISTAINCDESLKFLAYKSFNIVLLDLQIPPSIDNKLLDGEDLGVFIKQHYIDTKIIIITSISHALKAHTVARTIRPEGFIMKSDMDSADLLTAVNTVLQGKTYHSKTIETYLNEDIFVGKILDDYDKKILYYLSMGEKTKDLTKLIPLSIRAIEDRKVRLRQVFNISGNSDTNLIKEAKKRRII